MRRCWSGARSSRNGSEEQWVSRQTMSRVHSTAGSQHQAHKHRQHMQCRCLQTTHGPGVLQPETLARCDELAGQTAVTASYNKE